MLIALCGEPDKSCQQGVPEPHTEARLVDSFLDQFSKAGQKNSEGEFTISHLEALRKLRDFQLPRVGSFAANLVAAIVLGGGSTLQVSVTETGISFVFDKPLLSEQDLEMLFLSPFQSGAPMWRKELAIAANGTLGLPLKLWNFQSWNAETESGWEMKGVGGEQEVSPLRRPLGKASHSRYTLQFGYQRGLRIQKFSLPIHQELQQRCCFAPLRIRMNSQSVARAPVEGKTTIARRVWRSMNESPGTRLVGKAAEYEERLHEQTFSATMWVEPKDAGEVTLLVNGVAFPAPEKSFALPSWLSLIVASPVLQKDLSQSSITHNKTLRLISEWAAEQVPDLLEDRCRSFRSLYGNPLTRFHSCLNEYYETPTPAVQTWFEHQELLKKARSPQLFEELSEQARELPELRARGVWRTLRQAQQGVLREAWSNRDWDEAARAATLICRVAKEADPLSPEEGEVVMATFSLAGNSERAVEAVETRDLLWAPGRDALVLWLGGRPQAALEKTDEISGFWKHYLKFQMHLPDLAVARKHLDRAISSEPGAAFALNDLAELCFLQSDFTKALEIQGETIRRNFAGKTYWIHAVAQNARAHGTRSQFAYWTAYSGIAQLAESGARAARLVKKTGTYSAPEWESTLQKSESIKLSNTKWRYLFHCGLWALRREENWEAARRYLCRRLLIASMSEDGHNAQVPPFSVL